MANAFASAHDELAACQSAEFGETCEATIGEQTVPCVIYGNFITQPGIAPGGGGLVEGGTQMIAVKKSLLTSFAEYPNSEPPRHETLVTVRGQESYVLEVDERDGVFYITIGFPQSEE